MQSHIKKILPSIGCILSTALMWGCVASSPLYIGKIVHNVDIIPLQTGLHEGIVWKTFDIVFLLDYDLKGDTVHVSGRGRLGDHYQRMYEHLRYFKAYLFQVDKNDRVLDTVKLPTFSMFRPDDDFKFEKALRIFPETTGLTFGYSGTVYEQERSEPMFMQFISDTSFRRLP